MPAPSLTMQIAESRRQPTAADHLRQDLPAEIVRGAASRVFQQDVAQDVKPEEIDPHGRHDRWSPVWKHTGTLRLLQE